MGQPILIGHHSEKAHRNRLERAWKQTTKSVQEYPKARYWETRSQASFRQTDLRYGSSVTRRRIDRLEAEARKLERDVDKWWDGTADPGHYVLANLVDLEQLHEEIGYWKAHIEALKAAGEKIWMQDDVPKGSFVTFNQEGPGQRWYEVIRASAKSVTVPHPYGDMGFVVRKPPPSATGRAPRATT
jgi:hypothetical protein